MKKTLLPDLRASVARAAVALFMLSVLPSQARTIAGAQVPAVMQTDAGVLELALCGVRDSLWIEHYVTAVYVPRGASVQAINDAERPKAVRLHIVNSQYLPSEIPQKWRVALQSELDPQQMDKVRSAYKSLRTGDVITTLYTPDDGLRMLVNGRPLVTAQGHGVISAILKAWAEKESVTGKLARLNAKHAC